MQALITLFHVFAAISLIALVLIQHGKGADIGAAFGSGASNTMFGSQGVTPFLVKVTAILAFVFFLTSLSLSLLVSKQHTNSLAMPVTQIAPSTPVVPATNSNQPESVPPVLNEQTK